MSTELENLKTQLAELADRIAALEVEQSEVAWPKLGETYFNVDCDGEIRKNNWGDDRIDAGRFALGNVYRTHEEAEREVERRKVLTALRRLAKASGKCDWVKPTRSKYRLMYDAQDRNWGVESNQIARAQGAIYFATVESAKEAIETIGADRLMLLLED